MYLLMLQCITRFENPIAEILRIDDAGEMHVVGLTCTTASGFELECAQVKVPQDRTFDKSDILNVFQRDRLFHGHQNAFSIAQFLRVQMTIELVEIMPCPPLAHTKKPDDGKWDSNERYCQYEADLHHKIRANQGIEFGARGGYV